MVNPLGFVTLGVGGFTVGFLIGMALRFISKIVLYAVGLYLASLIVLASMGVIIINWDAMESLIYGLVSFLAKLAKSDVITSTGAFGVTMVLGAIYGALKGQVVQVRQVQIQNYRFFRRLR